MIPANAPSQNSGRFFFFVEQTTRNVIDVIQGPAARTRHQGMDAHGPRSAQAHPRLLTQRPEDRFRPNNGT